MGGKRPSPDLPWRPVSHAVTEIAVSIAAAAFMLSPTVRLHHFRRQGSLISARQYVPLAPPLRTVWVQEDTNMQVLPLPPQHTCPSLIRHNFLSAA